MYTLWMQGNVLTKGKQIFWPLRECKVWLLLQSLHVWSSNVSMNNEYLPCNQVINFYLLNYNEKHLQSNAIFFFFTSTPITKHGGKFCYNYLQHLFSFSIWQHRAQEITSHGFEFTILKRVLFNSEFKSKWYNCLWHRRR